MSKHKSRMKKGKNSPNPRSRNQSFAHTRSQLEQEVIELSEFRDRFHEIDKENAVLKERIRVSTASEIIFGVCLTIGAMLIGLTPYFCHTRLQAYLSLGIGGILIISGIISRAVRT